MHDYKLPRVAQTKPENWVGKGEKFGDKKKESESETWATIR